MAVDYKLLCWACKRLWVRRYLKAIAQCPKCRALLPKLLRQSEFTAAGGG